VIDGMKYPQLTLRQRIRKTLIIISFLLFPVIMNFLSPYVIIDGASQGIISGSFIIFGLMFLSALFSDAYSAVGRTRQVGWRKSTSQYLQLKIEW
jgi:hypothetical protein